MDGKYFKPRDPFKVGTHKYDLGTFVMSKETHRDRFFLNMLVEIPENELLDLYDYHSKYYQSKMKKPEEGKKEFFIECIELLESELKIEKDKDGYKMTSGQRRLNERRKSRFKKLLRLLEVERDEWNFFENENKELKSISDNIREMKNKARFLGKENKELESISDNIQEMKDQTRFLEKENERLSDELKEKNRQIGELRDKLKIFRVFNKKKTNIREDDFGTLINIFKNLIDLKDPAKLDDARFKGDFFKTQSKNTWIKLISNNFSIDGKAIKYSRVENYLVDRNRDLPKGARDVRIQLSKE